MTEVEEDEQIWLPTQSQGQDWADLEEEEGEGNALALTEEWGRIFEGKVEWADVISDEERSDEERDDHEEEMGFGQVRILQRAGNSYEPRQAANQSPPRHYGNAKGRQKSTSPAKAKTKNKKVKKGQQVTSPQRHNPENKRTPKGQSRASPDQGSGGSVWRQVGQRGSPAEPKAKTPARELFQEATTISGFESLHPALLERLKRTGQLRSSPYLSKAMPHLLAGKQFVSLGEDRGEKTGWWSSLRVRFCYFLLLGSWACKAAAKRLTFLLVSFVLSILQRALSGDAPQEENSPAPPQSVRALILSPSQDSIERIRSLVDVLSKKDSSAVSDVSITDVTWGERNDKRRKDGPVVVASPAQLLSALNKGDSSIEDYVGLESLVLDDVDKMLSTPVLQKILDTLKINGRQQPPSQPQEPQPQPIQRIIVSSNDELSTGVKNFIGHALGGISAFVIVRTDGKEVTPPPSGSQAPETQQQPDSQESPDYAKEREKEAEAPAAVSIILQLPPQAIYPVPQHLKVNLLLEILRKGENMESVVILSRLRPSAKQLVHKLRKKGVKLVPAFLNIQQAYIPVLITSILYNEGRCFWGRLATKRWRNTKEGNSSCW